MTFEVCVWTLSRDVMVTACVASRVVLFWRRWTWKWFTYCTSSPTSTCTSRCTTTFSSNRLTLSTTTSTTSCTRAWATSCRSTTWASTLWLGEFDFRSLFHATFFVFEIWKKAGQIGKFVLVSSPPWWYPVPWFPLGSWQSSHQDCWYLCSTNTWFVRACWEHPIWLAIPSTSTLFWAQTRLSMMTRSHQTPTVPSCYTSDRSSLRRAHRPWSRGLSYLESRVWPPQIPFLPFPRGAGQMMVPSTYPKSPESFKAKIISLAHSL